MPGRYSLYQSLTLPSACCKNWDSSHQAMFFPSSAVPVLVSHCTLHPQLTLTWIIPQSLKVIPRSDVWSEHQINILTMSACCHMWSCHHTAMLLQSCYCSNAVLQIKSWGDGRGLAQWVEQAQQLEPFAVCHSPSLSTSFLPYLQLSCQ